MVSIRRCLLPVLALAAGWNVVAAGQDPAERSINQFLAQGDGRPSYRAARRLEAGSGRRRGWLEANTQYSPETGFSYEITAEGGSGYVRRRVLRAVLEGERQVIARGEAERSSLTATNYQFLANGVDADGLANVLMSPRRHERTLVAGTMFLTVDGDLVRVEGRLAKNPSFWVRNVDIVRRYERINALVMPVSLESRAELRMLGDATLHVTYAYTEIDGRPVRAEPKARIGQAF